MSFFASTQQSGFQFVTIDANLLSNIFQAQSARAAVNTAPAPRVVSNDAAVIAPWQLNEEPQPLSRRISSVRQQTQFINTDDATVQAAGDDIDAQATFTLFNALTDLQTLAQYASEERTLESELARLDATFQTGFSQIQSYLGNTTLDKLDLLVGDKDSSVTTAVDVGDDSNNYVGSIVQTGAREDVIPGLDGTEVFSITLRKGTAEDVVTVDLSQITGDITIDAVVDLINTQIEAVKLVDEFGDPLLDDNGDPILGDDGQPVARYLTRFEVSSDENFDWRIGVDGIETETLSLSAAGEPSVYVASTFDSVVTDAPDKARLTQFTSAATGLAQTNRADVTATNASLTELAQDVARFDGETIDEDTFPQAQLATKTQAIATDSEGFTYIVGTSAGDFGNQLGVGTNDVFLTKLDSEGQVVFQRLVGSDGAASGYAVRVDANDNVIVAGQTTGRVDDIDVLSGTDSFVVKYTSAGREVFRTQLDTAATDGARALATDAAGNIYVGGFADGNISTDTTFSGGRDALVLKLDGATGAISDKTLLGTAGRDEIKSLTVASDGRVFAAVEEDGRGVVVELDSTDLSNELTRTDLGDLGGGTLSGIAVTGSRVVVSGTTEGGLTGGGTLLNASAGNREAFVTTLDASGATLTAERTRFIGTAAADSATGLAVDGDDIFVTGRTNDTLPGQTRQGARDGFVARIDAATGDLESLSQFGAFGGRTDTGGIAVSRAGESVLSKLGLRAGTLGDSQDRSLGTQSSITDGDFFYVAIDGKAARKINVRPSDTFRSLAAKINALGLGSVKAEVKSDQLEIEAINDGRIDLIAGDQGRDALARLGLEPQSILSSERLFNFEDDRPPEEQLGGSFALGLDASFNLRDKTTAKYVLSQLDSAISTVQRAFRSLTFDPIAFELQQQGRFDGPVSTRLTNQLANYQNALLRLQSGSQASTSFSI
ncbi:MAG: hypothetical protein AAF337_00540 [Pseudomonadota bacterium]